jgi:hypothetical protein
MLKLRKGETITASVLDEKRSNVLRFAARSSVVIDRRRLEGLTLEQISGLGDAAREGRLPAFVQAAGALGLTAERDEAPPPLAEPQPAPRPRGRPRREAAAPEPPTSQQEQPPPATSNEAPKSDVPAEPSARGQVRFEV